jgi:hypothetical protein
VAEVALPCFIGLACFEAGVGRVRTFAWSRGHETLAGKGV